MPSYNLATLQGLIYDHVDSNVGMFSPAQVTGVLNSAVPKTNVLLGFSENTVAIPGFTVANQLIYSTPPGILAPLAMYYEQRELEKLSLRELGERFRNWSSETTASYGPVARWAPLGIGSFVIHPQDAIGGGLLEAQGLAPITPMVNPGDAVDLDDELVPTLVDYCVGRLWLKFGGKPFANMSKAYQRYIAEFKDDIPWAQFTFPVYFIDKALEPGEDKPQ